MDQKCFVIIDGNSLINRAFYAIQRPMVTREGIYTQGIYGFLNMLQKIEGDYEPAYLAVTFDRKAPTFRHQAYEEYKAGRRKMPPELAMELPILKEVLAALGIKTVEMDGFEADDLIGTLARRSEEAGLSPLIITGDRDALQLASEKCRILLTKKGISEFALYDEAALREQYGFGPREFIELKGLMGDSSDNIPGIPGVGEKTAQKLVLEYGSVANLIQQADTISSARLREKVETYAAQALMSRKLAEIITAVPMEEEIEDFKRGEPDYPALIELYKKLEFNTFLKRLKVPEGAGVSAEGPFEEEMPDCPGKNGKLVEVRIRRVSELDALKEALKGAGTALLQVYGNEDHVKRPVVESVALLCEKGYYYLEPGKEDEKAFFSALRTVFEESGAAFTGHELQRSYYMLMRQEGFSDWMPETAFDSALARYVLRPGERDQKAERLYLEYFHREIPGGEEKQEDAGVQMSLLGGLSAGAEPAENDRMSEGKARCCALWQLASALRQEAEKAGFTDLLTCAELPLAAVLASMEAAGVPADGAVLKEVGEQLSEGIGELTKTIWAMAGEEFNIASPKQLSYVLFEKLGLPAGKKNKSSGVYSTGADVLENLQDKHPIAGMVLQYRTLTKLKGTYIDGLLPLIGEDGKIRAHFQQAVTATGRLSCTEPNLQNIPVRQELGRSLRRAFTADGEGRCLVGADYSQIELRVMAHLSEDPAFLSAYAEGKDIHRATAARVFHVSEEDVTAEMRAGAKAVNFGVIYGQSSFGLSNGLSISMKEADQYIKEYFREYQGVKAYLDGQVALAKERGYVETILGRRRDIHEIHASNYAQRQFGERLAMNSPIQGSAADLIKLAMIAVDREIRARKLPAKLLLQIHDELIVDCEESVREEVEELLHRCMEGVMDLRVPLAADVRSGRNWFELK